MSLSLTQLAAHATKALQQATGPVTVAYAWPHGWNGGDTISVGGHVLPLRHCDSPLQLREALGISDEVSRVLLVSIPENRVGQDVLARLFRHRLLHVDRWQLVQDEFEVHQIDPRLFSLAWMPEMLLASAASRRPSIAAVLTYDEAMESCLLPVLGVSTGPIDLEALLLACERGSTRWSEASAEPRELFRQHLAGQLGSLSLALLAALEAGNGHAAIAIGLVCEILYSAPQANQTMELRDARVRLEQRLNGYRLNEADGKQWADLAKRLIAQRSAAKRQHDFRLAIELLDAVGASPFAGLSSVLPEALDARLTTLGEAVVRFLRSPDELRAVEDATDQVINHQLLPPDHPGPETARMVVRLCRLIAKLGTGGAATDLVQDYLSNGAWEDWARRMLRGARPEVLARAVTKLLNRVGERRKESDEAFATAVAKTAAIGDVPSGVMPIESALREIIAPLAQHNTLLIVILDGMSQDVYLAIAESMAQRGWVSWSREGMPLALLATMPSVTECSRASLLSGRLTRGVASQERQAFAQNEWLRRTSKATKPPLLLHKAGLEQSHQLASEASSAISDPDQRIVGVVINAIDDALAKSEQVRIDWTMESIPLLVEVLEQARRAGRTVVLTSDHGHVLERQTALRPDGEGERWRRPGRAMEQGEISISGPRISTLMGEPLVLPWSESIRYAVKKNGYHGGVSRQEMLVPIGIWTAGQAPEVEGGGYHAAYPVAPEWWNSSDGATLVPVRVPARRNSMAIPADDLFSMARPDDWLDRLITSPILLRQRERIGRLALENDRLRMLLGKLQQHKGRCSIEQLATAIGQPVVRMRGVISVMERMLNLDGFPIVTLEQGTGTVLLDVALLKAQFLA